ncbi:MULTISPECIES: hypothetical protein [unclassified Duganella]|jgi:hypothetical protein|uniref:hypothetical protein n=1 Tax=unclassified Duganella TaxID=2636909 RepID=UPI000889C68B|nr:MULTISPECIES: hypothetical protein [unclassified Duganella]SDF72824.1 hypothetical protein SAMN05216320_1011119 [Duganella sp. OV458]SDI56589.1 hypothetical protein SAMN05428973_101296 [Duganella sp. OV510]
MPLYQVRYRGGKELTFNSPSILREEQIVERVLAEEKIIPGAVEKRSSLQDTITANHLGPIAYTEDESEPITIS